MSPLGTGTCPSSVHEPNEGETTGLSAHQALSDEAIEGISHFTARRSHLARQHLHAGGDIVLGAVEESNEDIFVQCFHTNLCTQNTECLPSFLTKKIILVAYKNPKPLYFIVFLYLPVFSIPPSSRDCWDAVSRHRHRQLKLIVALVSPEIAGITPASEHPSPTHPWVTI
jgi:hypothetical protein